MGGPAAGAPGPGGWQTSVNPAMTDAQKFQQMQNFGNAFKMSAPTADAGPGVIPTAQAPQPPQAPSGPRPVFMGQANRKPPQMAPLPTLSGYLQGY